MTLSRQGREGPEDLRGIITVIDERHDQRGRHVQRVNLHGARILVTGQSLYDLPWLSVIKHVHNIAAPESMGGTGIEKWTPSASARFTACFSQLRMVSSVTAHSGGDGW